MVRTLQARLPSGVPGPRGPAGGPQTTETFATLEALFPLGSPVLNGDQVLVTAPFQGGVFQYDALDTTSADNAGTIVVDAASRRWKRQFYGPLYAEWFGASEAGTAAANTASWQAAIDATGNTTDSAGVPPALTWAGEHTVNATLNIALTTSRGFRMFGSGTTLNGRGSRLKAATSFAGVYLLHIRGDATALNAIDTFELDNFALLAEAGTNCVVGLQIGETAKLVDAVVKNKVTRLSIEGFGVECWATNARDIYWGLNTFSATGVVGGTAFRLDTDSVAFQTDGHDFEGNTFIGPVGSGKAVSIVNGTSGAALKAVNFYGRNIIYSGAIGMEINCSLSGAIMGDIFIGDTQFDGAGPLKLNGVTGAKIENVKVENSYFRNVDPNTYAIWADFGSALGVCSSLKVTDNWTANYADRPFWFKGIENLTVEQNNFMECASDDALIYVDSSCDTVSASNNQAYQFASAVAVNLVLIASNVTGLTAIGNNAGPGALSGAVVSNLATGTGNLVLNPGDGTNFVGSQYIVDNDAAAAAGSVMAVQRYWKDSANYSLLTEGGIWSGSTYTAYAFHKEFTSANTPGAGNGTLTGGPCTTLFLFANNNGSGGDVTPLVSDAIAKTDSGTVFGANFITRNENVNNVKMVGLEIDIQPTAGTTITGNSKGLIFNIFSISSLADVALIGGVSGGSWRNGFLTSSIREAHYGVAAGDPVTAKSFINLTNGAFSDGSYLANTGVTNGIRFGGAGFSTSSYFYADASINPTIKMGTGNFFVLQRADGTPVMYMDGGTGRLQSVTGSLRAAPKTFATLPGSPVDADRDFITNSSVAAAGNFGAVASGGGANHVPVYYDGGTSQWRIG